ncbi:MAG: hypothetical protein CMB97_00440 [Flavobacteriaceae bacterium]|nr:hypothetical protein [Flavobacteriaceae bacterium]
MEKYVKYGPGLPERVRTDNEPVLRAEDSPWVRQCAKFNPPIKVTNSPTYCPQENGLCERWQQTIGK